MIYCIGTQIALFGVRTRLFINPTKCENAVKKKEASHIYYDFPADSSPSFPLSHVTAKAEKEHILKILRSTDGNKTRAADILGISRKTLWKKLKAFGIDFNEIER